MGLCCRRTSMDIPSCEARLARIQIWRPVEVSWLQAVESTLFTFRMKRTLDTMTPVVAHNCNTTC